MIFKYKRILSYHLLIPLFLLQSCANKIYSIKDLSLEKVSIPYKVIGVGIVDLRKDNNPMNWDLPLIGVKKINFVGNPILSLDEKSNISKTIKNSENPTGKEAKIIIKLIEGECQIMGDWSYAKELVRVVLQMEIQELDTKKILKSSSEITYEYKTLNALEESVVKTYNLALKNSTHQLLMKVDSLNH